MDIAAALAIAVGVTALQAWSMYRWVFGRPDVVRLVVVFALSLVAPAWCGALPVEARLVFAASVLFLCCRHVEVARRAYDPAMMTSRARFLLWLVIPGRSRAAKNTMQGRLFRQQGRARLARGLAIGGTVAVVELGIGALPSAVMESWATMRMTSLWVMYLVMTAEASLLSGLGMQGGIFVDELFHRPYLARSPVEMWGERWNRYVSWFAGLVYRPIARYVGPRVAVLVVFAGSGLAHEYIVWATLHETPHHAGWMVAYFCVQGVAVLATLVASRSMCRLPRSVAIGLHWIWLFATAELFMAPFEEIFAMAGWRLW